MLRRPVALVAVLCLLVGSVAGRPVAAADAPAAPPTAACPAGRESDRRAELEAKLAEVTGQISQKLGRSLGLPAEIVFDDIYVPDETAPSGQRIVTNLPAETTPRDPSCAPMKASSEGKPGSCRITVTRRGEGLYGFELDHLMAHEAFHCFQYDLAASAASAIRVEPWLAEGAAAWVGEAISGGSTIGAEYWGDWLREPGRHLFSRSYDAIGFFSHLQDSGVDPWSILVPMHEQGAITSFAALDVAVETDPGMKAASTWGPSYAQRDELGPDWRTAGPGYLGAGRVTTAFFEATLSEGALVTIDVEPLGANGAKVDVAADAFALVQEFDQPGPSTGMLRFADGQEFLVEETLGQLFCARAGGCECPDGSPGSAHDWQQVEKGELLVGIAGLYGGFEIALDSRPVDDICGHEPPEFEPWDPCWCAPGFTGSLDVRGRRSVW